MTPAPHAVGPSRWFCQRCAVFAADIYRTPKDPDDTCAECGEPVPQEERVLLLRRQVLLLERDRSLVSDIDLDIRCKMPEPKVTYTAADVAVMLHTSAKAVFARVARGQLPGAFKVGRSLRFRGPELLRFLAEGRAPSSRR